MRVRKRAVLGMVMVALSVAGNAGAQTINIPPIVGPTPQAPDPCAGHEWDYTSSYNSKVVVRGCGTLTNNPGGSAGVVTVVDKRSDGNPVYGFTYWFKLSSRCSGGGVEVGEIGSVWYEETSCSATPASKATHKLVTAETSTNTTGDKFVGWCNDDGVDCAGNGYMVQGGACAQMGAPVPDSCTKRYTEFHEPMP